MVTFDYQPSEGFTWTQNRHLRMKILNKNELDQASFSLPIYDHNGTREYNFQCERKDNSILVVRKIKIRKGTYPKEIYPSFVSFYQEVFKADRSKALLKIKPQNPGIVSN